MNWLQRWMYGRYGVDPLNIGLMVAGMVCSVVNSFVRWWPVLLLSYLLFGLVLFRMLSRNIPARQRENQKAISLARPVVAKLKLWRNMWQDRKTHRYFRCPGCRQHVRVPKGKGKIRIVCPKCWRDFIKKT